LIYILILSGGVALVRLFQQQTYAGNIKARAALLTKNGRELEDIINKLRIVNQYVDSKASVSTALYELNRLCPNDITIVNFSWEMQKKFSFKGFAPQIPDVLAFTNVLTNSDIFKGSQNRYARRRKTKDRDVIDFEIVVR
jgi:hypothetical protein